MDWTDYWKCLDCGSIWAKDWDGSDYNDDWNPCPKFNEGCDEFDHDELSRSEFEALRDEHLKECKNER